MSAMNRQLWYVLILLFYTILQAQPVSEQTNASQPEDDVLPVARVCSTPWPKDLKLRMQQLDQALPNLSSIELLQSTQQKTFVPAVKIDEVQMALLWPYVWKDAQGRPIHELKLAFLNGDPTIQSRVKTALQEWSQTINMKFTFGSVASSNIRIKFGADGKSWSSIGNTAANSPGVETMHYGWFTAATPMAEYSRTVLHEFGHALGAVHEHQSPAFPYHWNTNVVYAWCHSNNPPWSDQDCRDNILSRYEPANTKFTRFDRASIMVYAFPRTWTQEGVGVASNWTLSNDDKNFMATIYGGPASQ